MPGTTNRILFESLATASVSRCIGAGQIQMDRGFSATAELTLNPREHLFRSGDTRTHVYQVMEGVVSLNNTTTSESEVMESLVRLTNSFDTDLVVIGAYGHSRFREYVPGGVSKSQATR